MKFKSSEFVLEPAPIISRARRVLIKPSSSYPVAYPVSTSQGMLTAIISAIRAVSDADIILLESNPDGESIYPIYKSLSYDFPRVLMLDVKDCTWVEVENPLPKPFAVATFWVPNVILSSDYLITVSPLKVLNGRSSLTIMNLLSLLPPTKYSGEATVSRDELFKLGIDKVVADLYFTLPFDLGIVEARQKFIAQDGPTKGKTEECGLTFAGEPFQVDCEASETLGLKAEYLNLIKEAKAEFEM